jgi:hypothetical protein
VVISRPAVEAGRRIQAQTKCYNKGEGRTEGTEGEPAHPRTGTVGERGVEWGVGSGTEYGYARQLVISISIGMDKGFDRVPTGWPGYGYEGGGCGLKSKLGMSG